MLSIGDDHGPLLKGEDERIMYCIAQELDLLHGYNIIHRDFKADKALTKQFESHLLNEYDSVYEGQ